MTDKPYEPTLNDIYAKNSIYIRPKQKKYSYQKPKRYGYQITKNRPEEGYQIQVNHPEILPFFKKFKEEMKIPPWCPLSDAERLGFERLVLCGYWPIRLIR